MKMPPRPSFNVLVGNTARFKLFGAFKYKVAKDGNSIIVLDDWDDKNIVVVTIPQLIGIASKTGRIQLHRLAVEPVKAVFAEWEKAGLMKYVLTWDGSYCPRLIRGGKSLSNHAFGTAFDINAKWNGLGVEPAQGKGTVIPLVEIANKHGLFWGGHYKNRKDAMHFELCRL